MGAWIGAYGGPRSHRSAVKYKIRPNNDKFRDRWREWTKIEHNNSRSKGLPTGYAGSSPPGPMIYWLGRRGGTPWDRLGGALPVDKMTAATIITTYCLDVIQQSK